MPPPAVRAPSPAPAPAKGTDKGQPKPEPSDPIGADDQTAADAEAALKEADDKRISELMAGLRELMAGMMQGGNGENIDDIISELKSFQCSVEICDPWAEKKEVENMKKGGWTEEEIRLAFQYKREKKT